jgi:hypothetical protein
MLDQLTPEQAQALLTAVLAAIAGLFALILALAIPLARRALKHLSDLAGVKVSEQQMQVLDSVLTAGVNLAKEQAYKGAKGLIVGPKNGAEKKEIAKQAVLSLAPPALAESLRADETKLDMLIEAKLQSLRPWSAPEDASHDPLVTSASQRPQSYSLAPPAVPRLSIPTPIPPKARK